MTCFITPVIGKLDDMWHSFLLFTRDYDDFCTIHFGAFLHHEPVTGEHRATPRRASRELRRFHALVYDTLGAETFRNWFLRGRFAKATARRSENARRKRPA